MMKALSLFFGMLFVFVIVIGLLSIGDIGLTFTGQVVGEVENSFASVGEMKLKNCIASCSEEDCVDRCYLSTSLESKNKEFCENIKDDNLREFCESK